MSQFGMTSTLSTAAKDRDAFIDILVQAAAILESVESCHLYAVCKDASNNTDICVMELWDSQEAHDQSLIMPEIRELIAAGMPLLQGTPKGKALEPIGGKGL